MNTNNILQGTQFLKNKNRFKNNKIVEGFGNATLKSNKYLMDDLAAQYKGKITEYGLEYEKLINKKLNAEDDIFNIFGKTAKFNNKIYFITNNGVAREIPNAYVGTKTLDEFYESKDLRHMNAQNHQ